MVMPSANVQFLRHPTHRSQLICPHLQWSYHHHHSYTTNLQWSHKDDHIKPVGPMAQLAYNCHHVGWTPSISLTDGQTTSSILTTVAPYCVNTYTMMYHDKAYDSVPQCSQSQYNSPCLYDAYHTPAILLLTSSSSSSCKPLTITPNSEHNNSERHDW